MPKNTIDFDIVRKIGLALPGVEEGTAYGFPALKVRGKLLAVCLPIARPSPVRLLFAWISTIAPSCLRRPPMSIT